MSYIWIRYSDHPRIRQHVLRKHARSEVVGVARAANELSSPRAGTRDSLVPHPLPSSRRARPSLPSSLAPGSRNSIFSVAVPPLATNRRFLAARNTLAPPPPRTQFSEKRISAASNFADVYPGTRSVRTRSFLLSGYL